MLGSVYNGMSGLLAFSKGLDTISSNISNMNTPGFKSSELQFLDVFYQSQFTAKQNGEVTTSSNGSGVATGGTTTRFNQGELRSTGQDLDVAIDGNGFFVVRKDGQTLYTRAGQLAYDEEGFLVSRQNGARIASLDQNGNLSDINQNNFLSLAYSPTTEILIGGVLSTNFIDTNQPLIREINNVDVIDSSGKNRDLRIEFELLNINDLEWGVEVFDGTNSIAAGAVRFQPSSQPLAGENIFTFTLLSGDGSESEVSINMGDPGSISGSTSSSGQTTANPVIKSVDGFISGTLLSTTINQDGVLVSDYSNGESLEHAQLAIAIFLQLQDLEQQNGSLFIANDEVQTTLGFANDNGFGTIRGQTVELSNVELTQQFGDLIIVQRGYQASSQILTVSNEMLQQLIEMRGR